jgi:hypothetical protein
MGRKFWIFSVIACLFLGVSVAGTDAQQLEKASPQRAGFTILPITGGDPSGPPTLDRSSGGADLDPTVLVTNDPGAIAAVPEPSTIAMLFLGCACVGSVTVFRRRRRA